MWVDRNTQLWRRNNAVNFFRTGIEKIEIGFLPIGHSKTETDAHKGHTISLCNLPL